MLRLRMLSGEAVTSIPVEEIHDVKALKQRLAQRRGLPPRFRQRVLFRGEILKDTVTLDSPMNLDLVLLTFADVSQKQVDCLAAAAMQGRMSEVGRVDLQSLYSIYIYTPLSTHIYIYIYIYIHAYTYTYTYTYVYIYIYAYTRSCP